MKWFFLSVIIYLLVAGLLRSQHRGDPTSKESLKWDNRLVMGLAILIVAWVIGALVYGFIKPPCERQGVVCSQPGEQLYCWDTGDPDPHHIGHPVAGDHLCTSQELQEAGQ